MTGGLGTLLESLQTALLLNGSIANGIQFYSGNYLDGSIIGHGGKPYPLRSGLCLETQVFPDSPNQQNKEGWKSCVLRPNELYTHRTVHRFYAE